MASRRRLVWSPEAENDLIDIWTYLAGESSPTVADRQLRVIDGVCSGLCEWPHTGRSRDELLAGARSIASTPYVIFYRVMPDTVDIIRVLHGRRDIDAIFAGPDPSDSA